MRVQLAGVGGAVCACIRASAALALPAGTLALAAGVRKEQETNIPGSASTHMPHLAITEHSASSTAFPDHLAYPASGSVRLMITHCDPNLNPHSATGPEHT